MSHCDLMERFWAWAPQLHHMILLQYAEPNRDWTYCLRASSRKQISLRCVPKERCEWCPHYVADKKTKAPTAATVEAKSENNQAQKKHPASYQMQQGRLY